MLAFEYVPCSQDHSKLIAARALDHEKASELRGLVRCPSFAGPEFERLAPGFNVRHGVFYDESSALRDIEPIREKEIIDAVLRDFLVDFPFQSEADWQNFIGLILTPPLRPAIVGNLPFQLLLSCMERSDKTMLIETVLGYTIHGAPIPALTLSEKEEEREKRVLAILLAGIPIIHLDNLPPNLDSAVLSSLLTAAVFQGRLLGISNMVSIRNDVVFVGSGNNVRASGEMAKRVVPIRLLPKTDHPENRTDFRHPDIHKHVETARPNVLRVLLGMVENWRTEGRRKGPRPFGGFEGFAAVIGGVLLNQGYDQWLSNREGWVEEADVHGGAVTAPREHAPPQLDRVADILEAAAREIRSLAGTSGIQLPSLRGVEAQCDSNGQEPQEEIAMTPPTAETQTTTPAPELMTRAEIVALLRIHPRTFGRMLADPEVKVPEPIRGLPVQRWRRTTIERWLAERAK